MDYAISIKLTEKQYHVLKNMAKDEYRTLGNTAAMLMATGFGWYIEDRYVHIDKTPEDRLPDAGEYQRYTDKELKGIFDSIPFNQ